LILGFDEKPTIVEPSAGNTPQHRSEHDPPDPTGTAPTVSKPSRATVKSPSGIINSDGIGGKVFSAHISGAMPKWPDRSKIRESR